MSLYILPTIIRKNNKPPFGARVNWNHSLAKGLIGAWLLNENSGLYAYNIIDNTIGIFETGTQWFPRGINALTINSGINLGQNTKFKFTTENFTIICRVIRPSGGDWNVLISKGVYNAAGFYWQHLSGDNSLQIVARVGSSNVTTTSNANVFTPNADCQIGFTKTSNIQFYIDGKPVGMATQPAVGTLAYDTEYNFYIGRYNTAGYSWRGYILHCFIWNRALINSEIASLYVNPYQMIYRQIWDAYFVPAAAPPPTGGRSIFGYDNIFHSGGIIQT